MTGVQTCALPIYSNMPQAPTSTQLTIFLYHASHYSNTASPEAIGNWAGVSPGTITNCMNRVMLVLLLLHDDVAHFLTLEEKESARARVAEQVCPEWSNGHLMVDGMKFPLFQHPGLHSDTWFDKNKDYSLDCQVSTTALGDLLGLTLHQLVTLPDTLRIIDYAVGHTGSIHDSWSFQSTCIFKEHKCVLAPGEWIWADSAYPTETWCVSPYKKPIGGDLTPDQQTFNYCYILISTCVSGCVICIYSSPLSLSAVSSHVLV